MRAEDEVKSAEGPAGRLGPIAAFVGLGLVLFAAAMTAPLDYDEELYVSGAYFARSLSVYRDFVSVQPPLYTWILSAIFDLVGGWYLLTARVVTWLFGLGVCALLYSLLTSCGTGRVGALALVVGFATSPFTMRGTMRSCWNSRATWKFAESKSSAVTTEFIFVVGLTIHVATSLSRIANSTLATTALLAGIGKTP